MWTVAEPNFLNVIGEHPASVEPEETPPMREPRRLERLTAGWSLPASPPAVRVPRSNPRVEDTQVSFDWVGSTLRHIGTVVHQVLQRIAQDGLSAWTPERVEESRSAFRSALASLGVPAAELQSAVNRVVAAVQSTLRDERGRWILRGDRAETACEYAVCGIIEGRLVSARVDRAFLDTDGTRWIVDYKTSFHQGSDIEGFIDNELARYREQLTAYSKLFALLEDRSVRVGLYFPLLSTWRELEEAL